MIKTILWTQNESPNISPSIMVNGNLVDDEHAQEAFDELCNANEELELSPKKREKLYIDSQKHGKYISLQANYCFLGNSGGVYIQGCYLDEDEAHRKMPYMFLCEGVDNMEEGIALLKEESKKLHRNCNEYELRKLSEHSNQKCLRIKRAARDIAKIFKKH